MTPPLTGPWVIAAKAAVPPPSSKMAAPLISRACCERCMASPILEDSCCAMCRGGLASHTSLNRHTTYIVAACLVRPVAPRNGPPCKQGAVDTDRLLLCQYLHEQRAGN